MPLNRSPTTHGRVTLASILPSSKSSNRLSSSLYLRDPRISFLSIYNCHAKIAVKAAIVTTFSLTNVGLSITMGQLGDLSPEGSVAVSISLPLPSYVPTKPKLPGWHPCRSPLHLHPVPRPHPPTKISPARRRSLRYPPFPPPTPLSPPKMADRHAPLRHLQYRRLQHPNHHPPPPRPLHSTGFGVGVQFLARDSHPA